MPKTHNHLFNEITSYENLYRALHDAARHKRYHTDVIGILFKQEETIEQLHSEMRNGSWFPSGYREFMCKTEVKRRIIHAPDFRDRIVHHAICGIVAPLFLPKFIADSYAVTPGKGTHRAVHRVQGFLREAGKEGAPVYVLQCDIHHYYQSIQHEILFEQIKRTIRDKRVLELWWRIIDGFNGDTGVGLPIGALTSQLSANIYLNVLDHFVKECIGWKMYLRYMDDFILIGNDKQKLWSALADIRWLLDTKLRLKLNSKTALYPACRGIDFAGYRTWTNRVLPRKRNVKAAKRRFVKLSKDFSEWKVDYNDVHQRVASFLGYMSHCNGHDTAASTLKRLALCRNHLDTD